MLIHILIFTLIEYRLQYEGKEKYLRESVTGIGIGMQNLCIGLSKDGWGNRVGMSADVQATWHDSTVHVQRLFPPK